MEKKFLKLKRGLAPAELDCYVTWRLSMKVLRDICVTDGPELWQLCVLSGPSWSYGPMV